ESRTEAPAPAASQYPGQQLPIATRPAMMPAHGDVVPCGKLLDHLDIGRQASPGEDAFEQIVAEERRPRHAAGQCGLERINVVNALAGVGPFAKQILVNIRN